MATKPEKYDRTVETDVFIAGSGPIGCAFAREILDKDIYKDDEANKDKRIKIWMAEIGAQDNPVIGAHHKNSVKYQKDIDAFVHVIQGALQPVSVPPASTYMATLGESAWSPQPGQKLVSSFNNPKQVAERNLPGCSVTRTVGGMSTHWTCACPEPHADERKRSPIKAELPVLLEDAKKMLNVNLNEYDGSVRHNLVKAILEKKYPGRVQNLPLAVKRNQAPDSPQYVTWSGANTVLGDYATNRDERFQLHPEHKVVELERNRTTREIEGVKVRNLKNHELILVKAKKYVIACGSVCTPQILWNSGFGERDDGTKAELPALGRYLTEQSIAFCQIVLKREYIHDIENSPLLSEELREQCRAHHVAFPEDPIHIPFTDPEPQVTMPYTTDGGLEWHTQIHRDAFSYGDVGPRADPRLIVDLRFFGRQDPERTNRVKFEDTNTDIYGLPQATFEVRRNPDDAERDQKMMLAMCEAANQLGPFLPGSYPQFMEPGLALHITGTTRVGGSVNDSVANEYSQVHGHPNLYVGGNGVIPDSTACNPTRTSVAYALKAARHIQSQLQPN